MRTDLTGMLATVLGLIASLVTGLPSAEVEKVPPEAGGEPKALPIVPDQRIRSLDTGLAARVTAFDAAISPRGEAHLVYVHEKDLYYAFTAEPGKGRWTSGLQLNGKPGAVSTLGQAGPSLARSDAGVLSVVWHDGTPAVWHASSEDDGKNWSRPVRLGRGNLPVAAWGAKGLLHVAWLDDPQGRHVASQGAMLFRCRSEDGGKTFSAPEEVTFRPGNLCSTSRPAMAATPAGKVLMAVRGEVREIRDVYVLTADRPSSAFAVQQLSDDSWKQRGGAFSGPALALSSDGLAVGVAWMSRRRVYWSFSADGGDRFGGRVAPVTRSTESDRVEDLPALAMDPKGRRATVYQDGPLLSLAVDGPDGKPLCRGTLEEPGRCPRVAVTPEGHFRVFWLARKEGLFTAEVP